MAFGPIPALLHVLVLISNIFSHTLDILSVADFPIKGILKAGSKSFKLSCFEYSISANIFSAIFSEPNLLIYSSRLVVYKSVIEAKSSFLNWLVPSPLSLLFCRSVPAFFEYY